MGQAAISVDDVVKCYDPAKGPVLDGVSVSIGEGESVGLLGPNGAGKTTLVKLLSGVTRPTSGQVRLLGQDPFLDGLRVKRSLGVVHQATPLDMMLTVRDNLRIAAMFRGFTWRRAGSRILDLVEEFELTKTLDNLAFTLSGGQMRRLQIIRVLIAPPQILLLDEPSAGLDVLGRRKLWNILDELKAQHGTTIVLTSHNLDEVERNSENVIILHRGRVLRHAHRREIVGEFGGRAATLSYSEPVDVGAVTRICAQVGLECRSMSKTEVEVSGDHVEAALPALLERLAPVTGAPRRTAITEVSLEEAFIKLTAASAVTEGALR
ncbi:ABC transporter ATP-binding protein [Streptacidiphilus albus]|uniref:ABC transporter ATP-binding protein n=1 Tax=Streptacidiphilus albus TaxID=105425 RepID=UPI0009DF06B3|nr:ABC transporter ATP-binding protein [Streptacidiphilus albus]